MCEVNQSENLPLVTYSGRQKYNPFKKKVYPETQAW